MEKLKKVLLNILFVMFVLIAITETILMLSYNDYHCSVIGDYTFIKITDDELEPDYNEGDLVLVKKTKAKKINPGDYIFVYRNISTTQFEVKYAQVIMKDDARGENYVQYILDGGTVIEHSDVIGSTEDIKVIPHLGTIFSILESRYGFLFLIVVPSFVILLYQVYELIMEIKYGETEEDEEDYDDDEEEYDEDEEDEEDEEDVKPAKKATTKASTTKKSSTKASTKSTPAKSTTRKTSTTKESTAKASTAKASTATKKTSTKGAGTTRKTSTKTAGPAKKTTAKTAK